jgi:DNA (cytosine-5)-methyltransferase 1
MMSAGEATIARVTTRGLTVASLYSGAGGLDCGFADAGFDVQWAVDHDPFAVETYNRNLAPVATHGDVLHATPPPSIQPDVLIGGPPCQGFSVIGRMDPTDPRSQHVDRYLDVVAALKPRAFVMENVKALGVSPRWAPVRERLICRATDDLEYHCRLIVLNAADYGVPQARERMFLIGLRDAKPPIPPPTHVDERVTVREALAQLPRVGEPGNDGLCSARVIPAKRPIMRPGPFAGSLLFNGSGRPLQLDGPAKTLPASMGGNATPIIDQDELEHGHDPWVVEYHRRLLRGGRPLKRAPKRMRRITIQEAAALQTFPTGWTFAGPQVAQYRQIGNAVPPRLAQAVATAIREALHSTSPAIGSATRALLAA